MNSSTYDYMGRRLLLNSDEMALAGGSFLLTMRSRPRSRSFVDEVGSVVRVDPSRTDRSSRSHKNEVELVDKVLSSRLVFICHGSNYTSMIKLFYLLVIQVHCILEHSNSINRNTNIHIPFDLSLACGASTTWGGDEGNSPLVSVVPAVLHWPSVSQPGIT